MKVEVIIRVQPEHGPVVERTQVFNTFGALPPAQAIDVVQRTAGLLYLRASGTRIATRPEEGGR